MRFRRWCLAIGLGIAAASPGAQAAVTEENFHLRTTGDLVALCSATSSDPMYTAAVNFCHGFALGTVRVLQQEDAAVKNRRMFCLPDPLPSRNEAIASFVAWVQGDPKRMADNPSDSIAAYLGQQYPCRRSR